jgi:hypothetical protein
LDSILDFSGTGGGNDVIDILASAFGDLTPGALSANQFSTDASGAFTDSTQRFSFDQSNHTLYYDGDGSGDGGAVALARLENGANLINGDIHLV